MSYPITHVVVQNTPPPSHVVTIGHLYPITQQQQEREVVFRTAKVDEEEEDIERWEDDGGETDEEVKVVKPRRGRRPKAAEVAETK